MHIRPVFCYTFFKFKVEVNITKLRRLILTFILGFVLLFWNLSPANAMPPIPASFWGTVTVNGASVPADLPISAWINGVQYAVTITLIYGSDSVYSLSVPGDDPTTVGIIEGGTQGQTIVFKIDPLSALQTGTWQSGLILEINLTAVGYRIFLPLIRR